MSQLTDIAVANRALARIGASAITSFDDEDFQSQQVSLLYAETVEELLALADWQWARQTLALDALGTAPSNGWAYGYSRPALALRGPVAVLTNPRDPLRPLRHFAVDGSTIYADSTPLWATFIVRKAEDLWPPEFRRAVTTALAAALAVPLAHDPKLAELLTREAFGITEQARRGGLVGSALLIDAQSATGPAALGWSDPLTRSRADF